MIFTLRALEKVDTGWKCCSHEERVGVGVGGRSFNYSGASMILNNRMVTLLPF